LKTCFTANFGTQNKLTFFAIKASANNAAFQKIMGVVKQQFANMAAVAYVVCARKAYRPMICC
jgi:hypothetical protein